MMIPTALYPITKYIENLNILTNVELPKSIAQRKRFFSRGQVNMYQGEGLEKFINLSVKGLHLYHYDFGIVYPQKEYIYPIFFYQVIIAPQRVLVLVHYAFEDPINGNSIEGVQELLLQENQYEDLFIKEFTPQSFIADDIIQNKFNGLIRTKDIDKAYEAISLLFNQWHKGLLQQSPVTSQEEIHQYEAWYKGFRQRFYQEDYGFLSTKRYLGAKWTKEVFENYLFNI